MYEPIQGKTADELIDLLIDSDTRFGAYLALNEMGQAALPQITAGLQNGNWEVRRWCAILLDHHADDNALEALIPLLRDPKAKVRLWAVHSLSCDGCKVGENPIDVVPHLIERIEVDESIRVRRMAVAMLADPCTVVDARVPPVLKRILADESDRKLKLHATNALKKHQEAGLGR